MQKIESSDPGRQKLEEIAAAQRAKEPATELPAEARERFSAEVRARMASPSNKNPNAPRRTLTEARFQFARSAWNIWDVVPDVDTTVEQLADPAYWTNVAQKLSPWDEIIVRAEDGSYLAKFVVVECGQRYARVKLLPGYPLMLQVAEPDAVDSLPNDYAIKWMGPHSKYAAIRDGAKLRDGFSSKGSAQAWLRDHLRVMAA